MSAKVYWNLLVLFDIFCQGIVGTLSEKYIDESSELLVRQKRVINHAPGGDNREQMRDFPHVVSIRKFRTSKTCAGVIVSNRIVLTLAKCVEYDVNVYRVSSGSARKSNTGRYVSHNVTGKIIKMNNHPYRPQEGIALITVTPPFNMSINTRTIPFYEGPIYPGLSATISGWGCNAGGDPGTAHPDYLRSIRVPIISNQDCATLYIHTFAVLESDICTFDASLNQYCGVDDEGAALVISENNVKKLAGMYLWSGSVRGRANPDVFINLQYPIYSNWIAETMHLLHEHHH